MKRKTEISLIGLLVIAALGACSAQAQPNHSAIPTTSSAVTPNHIRTAPPLEMADARPAAASTPNPSSPPTASELAGPVKIITLGGEELFRIREGWGGLTTDQRADAIQLRLNEAQSSGTISPDDITVGKLDDEWCVLLRRRFFTVSPVDAEVNGTTAHALALTWAAAIQKVLPPLTRPTFPTHA